MVTIFKVGARFDGVSLPSAVARYHAEIWPDLILADVGRPVSMSRNCAQIERRVHAHENISGFIVSRTECDCLDGWRDEGIEIRDSVPIGIILLKDLRNLWIEYYMMKKYSISLPLSREWRLIRVSTLLYRWTERGNNIETEVYRLMLNRFNTIMPRLRWGGSHILQHQLMK